MRLMLCGDVMTGRGVDQILPHPSDPVLYERAVSSAEGYVELAEAAHGPIPRLVSPNYVWGDALERMAQEAPDARIINLETAVTQTSTAWPKGINYRMHPGNISCLSVAGIDCCSLANNHTLDWGRDGLLETLDVLQRSGRRAAGAGRNDRDAAVPAIIPLSGTGRVLVYAIASPSSGVPASWAAGADRAGINVLDESDETSSALVAEWIHRDRRLGDFVVCSIHWGANWGYEIPDEQRRFAHALIEHAGVDVIHGHSSHHPKAIEIHKDRPIFYGCGDFINDYEGIPPPDPYRDDLVLMYIVDLDADGRLTELRMFPFRIRRFSLHVATQDETEWLHATLNRQCRVFGKRVEWATGCLWLSIAIAT